MEWNLDFISEENFKEHIRETIKKYGDKLQSVDLKQFNSNIIDPIKLIFDKSIYQSSWQEIISNEIFRQRDKSNNNDIGYFHQNIFAYFDGCEVPETGWDVIYQNSEGIQLPEGDVVHTIYVEMKNKHNTMNSSSSGKTYIRMQDQLLSDDDCACFLVEAIAKRSQNITWETKVDGRVVRHRKIRRVSIDRFYSLLTGDDQAFYKMCMVLPGVISTVIEEGEGFTVPDDTVLPELENIASLYFDEINDFAIAMALYMLGFSTYLGFSNGEDTSLRRVYEYAKRLT